MTDIVKEMKATVEDKNVSPKETKEKPEMLVTDPWDNWTPGDEIASNWADV